MYTTYPELLEKLRILRNEEAWDTFVSIYFNSVMRWLREAGGSPNELEDMAQEVFLIVYRRIDSFQRQRNGSFRSWMKMIVRNVVLKKTCNEQEIKAAFLGDGLELYAEEEPENDSAEKLELIQQVIRHTKKDFKPLSWRAFEMIYFEGVPTREVATALGMSENAIYIATGRILNKIRHSLDQFVEK